MWKILGTLGKKLLNWIAPGLAGALGSYATNQLVNGSLTGKEREQNQFNAEQADLQREFARDERLASQDFNASQAQAQMDFQERMSNTQYQRQVADMQAAGVNPAMAMGGITGASASGAMAQSSPSSGVAASGSASLQGLSDVVQLAKLKKDLEFMDTQIAQGNENVLNLRANREKTSAETNLVNKQVQAFDPMNKAQLDNLLEDLKNKQVQRELDRAHISESDARKQLTLNNAFLAAIDISTRDELNKLNARLRIAQIADYGNRANLYQAQINELYQRAILESAQAGNLDQQTINLALEEGILRLDESSKRFDVDHQKADRNWRIAGQVISSVVGVTGAAAGIMTGTGVLRNAGINSARLSFQSAMANTIRPDNRTYWPGSTSYGPGYFTWQ